MTAKTTMADVARAAGVSKMTVSYTYAKPDRVADATRERVFTEADRLGFTGPDPAGRSLRRRKADALGVVLGEPLGYAFEDPQAARFLSGIAEVASDRALAITLIPVAGLPSDAERIREVNVDGFVLWTTGDDDPVLDAVVSTGRPAAILGGPGREGIGVVAIDDRAAARAIAREAFASAFAPAVVGHPLTLARHRELVSGPDPAAATYPVGRHRLEGYRDFLEAAGHRWEAVPVSTTARNLDDEGRRATESLYEAGFRPDAIAAMTDELAFGVLQALAERGLHVPDDVQVTGWDDSDRARRAGLTTVRQSLREQGAQCARLVLAALDLATAGPGLHDPMEGVEPVPAWSIEQRASTGHLVATGPDDVSTLNGTS